MQLSARRIMCCYNMKDAYGTLPRIGIDPPWLHKRMGVVSAGKRTFTQLQEREPIIASLSRGPSSLEVFSTASIAISIFSVHNKNIGQR